MQALLIEAKVRTGATENPRKNHRLLRCIFQWITCVVNLRLAWSLTGYFWYLSDW